MRTLLAVFIGFGVSAFTSAAENSNMGSEFFHQAASGTTELSPAVNYSSTTVKFTASKSKSTGFMLTLPVEYGINEMLSIGGALSYSDSTTKNGTAATDAKGLGDLEASVKGTIPMGLAIFKFGADLDVSPGDQKTKANGDSNEYSGGTSFEPYVGYEMSSDTTNVFGVKLRRDINIGDKSKNDNGSKSKVSGGEITQLDFFFERALSDTMKFGANLAYAKVEDEDDSVSGKTEALSPFYYLRLYLPVKMGTGTLVPNFTYLMSPDDSTGGNAVDSVDKLDLLVYYRLTF